MKAFIDPDDGSLQIRYENQEEAEALGTWIARSYKDLANGFIPRLEIKKNSHAI
jgi:hypothetical protein